MYNFVVCLFRERDYNSTPGEIRHSNALVSVMPYSDQCTRLNLRVASPITLVLILPMMTFIKSLCVARVFLVIMVTIQLCREALARTFGCIRE